MKLETITEQLNTDLERGLNEKEVFKRQKKYGLNKLPDQNKKGFLSIFISQFNDFMIFILMAATIISIFMGEFTDAITIFAIIIINAILGFIQEYKAERSLDALKKLTALKARIIRNEVLENIDSLEIVPGDIILLETGDKVPADGRIIQANGLQIDESILTGESTQVEKTEKKIYTKNLKIINQKNMVFMGTKVTRGKARVLVVNTGLKTEMGKIANMLEEKNKKLTPLQKKLKHLGKWLILFSIFITLAIVFIGIIKGQSIYNMFLVGVSLAVAAIPEGLPAIVTLVLAMGVQRMSKKNAIVRKLPSVETLGCATVICSDKTGTLTQNEMEIKKIYFNEVIHPLISRKNSPVFEKLIKIGVVCNDSKFKKNEKNKGVVKKIKELIKGNKILPDLIGDPTDIAFIKAANKLDYDIFELRSENKVIAEGEFDSRRKRMSVIVEKRDKTQELWIKGAPEIILNLSTKIYINGEIKKLNHKLIKEIYNANEIMANQALRVIGIAYKDISGRINYNKVEKYENNLVFIGLAALIDPPRPEVYDAVKECKRAGIRPIMITGDHKLTARVIAENLGIVKKGSRVIESKQLENINKHKLSNITKNINVFARVTPEDKLNIVKTLKNDKEIVAMTGDGVNDAPAVKEADIGISMGGKGTDVTKEVSSLILADDNFATIISAVKEGRKIYNNIRKFIRYLLSCNIGEILTIFMGVIMGLPLPLLPIQILWVNLVTDGLPALALGMDNDTDDVMKKNPRNPEESVFAHGMVSRIISQGVLIGLSTIIIYLLAIFKLKTDINTARTMAFSTLVFSQLFFVFSCKSEEHTIFEISPFSNLYLLIAVFISAIMQIAVIYWPLLNNIFNTSILNNKEWFLVLLLSIWSTLILNLIQYLFKNKK